MRQRRSFGAAWHTALSALALVLGCANDLSTSLEGKPCSKAGACLAGYRCVEEVCVSDASSSGAGGRSSPDGGSGGAPPDAASSGGASAGGRRSSGGAATDGGTAGGGGTSGGAGGASGDASTGGATPVEAGAGGMPSIEAGTGGAGVLGFTGVQCDDERCDTDEVCCISDYPGFPNAPPASAISCEDDSSGCEYSLTCDGDHDCPGVQICCGTQVSGDWRVICTGNCGSSGGVHVECTRQAHCDAGEVCCGTWSTSLNHYRSILCATSCAGNRLCASDAECDSDETCTGSSSMPGFGLCL